MQIVQDQSLSAYTTFKIGGPAKFFVTVDSQHEVEKAVDFAQQNQLPFVVLGGGSNMLCSDDGYSGLVIHNAIKGITTSIEDDQVLITTGAGELFDDLVAYTVEHGYWGLENLSHIPGSVGATPIQNVGAYGVEIEQFVQSVKVFDVSTNTVRTLSNQECKFAYRDSLFKHEEGSGLIVLEVVFVLSTQASSQLHYKDLAAAFPDGVATQKEIRSAVIQIRSKKFPDWSKVGTAGSFFKNPIITKAQAEALAGKFPDLPMFPNERGEVKIALGWLLDKALHLKGVTQGKVGTYQGQALVLVSEVGATEREVRHFAESIQKKVHDATGVSIQWEVTPVQ